VQSYGCNGDSVQSAYCSFQAIRLRSSRTDGRTICRHWTCTHRLAALRCFIPPLHDQANIEQSSSKHPANAFEIHVHDVSFNCSMFAWWLLDRVNGVLLSSRQCLNCRGVGGSPSNCFFNPLHTVKLCSGGQLHTIYIGLHHNFGRAPTVEKFKPPDNFSQFKHWFKIRLNVTRFVFLRDLFL